MVMKLVQAAAARVEEALDQLRPTLPPSLAPHSCFVRFSGAEPVGAINIATSGNVGKVQIEVSVMLQVGCTFAVLLGGTRSMRLAALCTLTLVCMLISFYGTLALRPSFELGLTEAFTGVFAMGYAIDYPMHVAVAYDRARARGRRARAVEAVRVAGVAVFGSALSTLCAMAAMQMAAVNTFRSLGLLVSVLVGFSLLFTFALLAPLLSLVGPEDRDLA